MFSLQYYNIFVIGETYPKQNLACFVHYFRSRDATWSLRKKKEEIVAK